jgi:chromosome segregation ATPase
MAAGTEHTQNLRLKETQMNLGADPCGSSQGEDFDDKLRDAQQQLELLQHQREELERQKSELDELNCRKEEFINGQIEITERLATSVTAIDRELFELRQELDDLEQTRQSFAAHLARVEQVEPEGWQRDSLGAELDRALLLLEQAEEEFESAVSHFAGGRTRGIFGNPTLSGGKLRGTRGEFMTNLKNGMAFNLPIIVLGALALLVYFVK